MNVALIPARSGSKRLPHKNIKLLNGRPLLSYSIVSAIESGLFAEVIVSTDSEEIARVAKGFGAEVPFVRPIELSDDHAGTTEVIAHAVQALQLHNETDVQVCCVYPTSVLMNSDDLMESLKLLQEQKWQYVFAASQPNSSPLRSFKKSRLGGAEMLFPNYWGSRSQDLPACFVDAGFFYWANAKTWVTGEPIFGAYSTFIEVPEIRAIDVNTESDWLRAESIFELLKSDRIK